MTRHQITNAPSKYTLSIAFFDLIGAKRRSVTFQIKGPLSPEGGYLDVVINNLQWEDGSGESWNFEGYAVTGLDGARMLKQMRVKGYFATTDRKGWIDLE